jgi:hypothetical protein
VTAAEAWVLCLHLPILCHVDLPLPVPAVSALEWCLTRPLMFMDLPLQVTSTAAWLSPLSDVMNCCHGHLTPPPLLFKDLPLRVTTATA